MKGSPSGRDWNGNGKQDSFDRYIDYKISNSNNNSTASNRKNDHQSERPKNVPQSNGIVIFKSLLTIGLCFLGFALPISTDMGSLGTAICLLAAVAISMLLWRS